MSRRQDYSGIHEDDAAIELVRYRTVIRACDRWLAANDPTYVKDYHRASIQTHFPTSHKHITPPTASPTHTTDTSLQDHSQFAAPTGSIADIDYFGDDDHTYPHDPDETCI